MDIKGYRHIPRTLFDTIKFLALALPKRSMPTFLELLQRSQNSKVQVEGYFSTYSPCIVSFNGRQQTRFLPLFLASYKA